MADVPSVECKEHVGGTAEAPCAESGSGFIALFETLVINWLKTAKVSALEERQRPCWNAAAGGKARLVAR